MIRLPQQFGDPQATSMGPAFRTALAQLAHASACARDAQCDKWDFALSLESILALGASKTDIRWLSSKGFLEHACEITAPSDATRKFRPIHNLAFVRRSCFVLTDAGELFAARMAGDQAAITSHAPSSRNEISLQGALKPQWDRERRVLRAGLTILKEYRLPSPNQEAILVAFQEEDWPHHIYDPLRPQGDQDPKSRLHDTIKCLNRHHKRRLIRFRGDGTGKGVCWEFVDDTALAVPAHVDLQNIPRAA